MKRQVPPVILRSVQTAREAGLRYVEVTSLDIKRVGENGKFRYIDGGGRTVRDVAVLARIQALVIPPAWTDVRICALESGHLQAIGRDARGRLQYRYHPRWREVRDCAKYDHILEFAAALPRIRRRVARDLARRALSREKVLATVVSLLETTLIRVGNEEYARSNGSFGLSTMRERHVAVHGETVEFRFPGKSGRRHSIQLRNRKIARVIRRLQELPGQRLFQYEAANGVIHDIESGDVNAYLREIGGADFTAKGFRTWAGTVLAGIALIGTGEFATAAHAKRNIVAAIEFTAARLGNTPAICRKCYVHPEIFSGYLDGGLAASGRRRIAERRMLAAEETMVLSFLRRRLGKGVRKHDAVAREGATVRRLRRDIRGRAAQPA
jgi:DNA topoisomerase-1